MNSRRIGGPTGSILLYLDGIHEIKPNILRANIARDSGRQYLLDLAFYLVYYVTAISASPLFILSLINFI